MSNNSKAITRALLPQWRIAAAMMLIISLLALAAGSAHAAPAAGTTIGNAASATYTDSSSIARTATSNTVETIVQQVAALQLGTTQSRIVAPGGTVYFPHTLTNSGNGTDTFNLATVNNAGTTDFTAIAIYADANGDGVPDNFTPIANTGALATGATFNFVIAATVPGTATAGQTDNLTVTATSSFNGTVSASNTDTANITANAVVNITKALSSASGNPGTGPYTYTITYTNTGNATASAVTVTDVIPTGMTYVAGSARWSVTGATVLTDANNADAQGTAPNTVVYDFGVTVANRATFVINQVTPGQSGNVTFQVNVNAGVGPQVISNTANLSYNDGAAVQTSSSNAVPFSVNQTASVIANGSAVSNVEGAGEPVTVAAGAQGSTVSFDNYIWNTGNGTDTFDITVTANSFPPGSTVILYRSDGVTPLVDTNGNPTPDTGPVAAGASYRVVLKVTLPANATGGPFSVTKTATSVFNSAVSNSVTDMLSAITTSSVDLANNAANGPGDGAYVAAQPASVTNSANPGTTTTFTLFVENTSAVADSYNLAASTVEDFSSIALPAGWTVTFKLGTGPVGNECSTVGATITNTGTINAGASRAVCAEVSVPASQVAIPSPGQSIYFRVQSPTTGAADRLHDAVLVNTLRVLTLTPNGSGQVFPAGSVNYSHDITNSGNVTEGDALGEVALALANSLPGWTAVIYWDANNDGALDVSDPAVTDLSQLAHQGGNPATDPGLDPGESARVFVKVFAPAGAAIGDSNATTFSATVTGAINGVAAPAVTPAVDITQVIAGQVTLLKTQVLDADCSGQPEAGSGAYSNAQITTGAVPGACIRYRIIATNVGTAAVTGLVVSDSTPANSTFDDGSRNSAGAACGTGAVDAGAATSAGSITAPACGASGTVSANIGTLNPGQSATITFGVMIDN